MGQSLSTCWTVVRGAAAGEAADRDLFARCYAPVLRGYLGARWRGSPCVADVEDAVQEVFVECFRQGGVLDRAEEARPGGFRAFLYGVARNVALRCEARRARDLRNQPDSAVDFDAVPERADTPPEAFDRAWAEAVLRQAGRRQAERAREAGEAALRRVELLRLRFHEGLPIRDIARRWQADPAALHHEYARARQEFKKALLDVVAFHHPGSPAEVEREAGTLMSLLAGRGT
jgi:RNA polymerase sigma-70 factor (ECF subfamily)